MTIRELLSKLNGLDLDTPIKLKSADFGYGDDLIDDLDTFEINRGWVVLSCENSCCGTPAEYTNERPKL